MNFLKCIVLLVIISISTGKNVNSQTISKDIKTPLLTSEKLLEINLPDVRIISSELSEDQGHCIILGIIGKEIKFELLLPSQWNSRFVMGGGGNFVGEIQNIARYVVNQGYATVGTDTGHEGLPIKADWAYNNMERQLNFGHMAVHRTALVAKSLIDIYYGAEPEFSYFMGCSRGGGQAMMEAQRYPDDFDGIIAGAPAINWPATMAKFIKNTQVLFPDPKNLSSSPITKEHVLALQSFILEKCDNIDGLKDKIINIPKRCNPNLDELIVYKDVRFPDLTFSKKQIEIIKTIYSELVSEGIEIYPSFPYGTEGGWWGWIVGPIPSLMNFNFPTSEYAFGTEGAKYLIYNDAEFDYITWDFTNFLKETRYASAYLDATSTDYSKFRNNGSKMIIYHGLSDGGLSANVSIEHFEGVLENDPATEDYLRLFLLPGFGHCGGGFGPGQTDWLELIRNWVEKDEAPYRVVVSKVQKGEVVMTRPVFPYPRVTIYDGTGDPNLASSFKKKE